MSHYNRPSIKLLLARAEADTVSGVADAVLLIPAGGRTIEGGVGCFENQEGGDYLTIELTDDDNLLGFGAGAVIDSFDDQDVSGSNKGWYFFGTQPLQLHPIVNDDPTDLPGGFYLHVYGHKKNPATSDTLFVNFHWGRRLR